MNPYQSLTMACSVVQSGDTIVLHGGPFVQSTAAVVNVSNVTIMGNGATVQAASQSNVVLLSIGAQGTHCTVRDLVVNGSLTNGADVDNGAVEVTASAAHFQNVYVHDSEGYGFRLVASWDNVVIENCRVMNCSTGIQEAMYGTADVHNANFLSNRLINNRSGGIRGTNNSGGAYAIFGEKIIGNVIHNDTLATNALGIELYGGQIVGEAKISHQGADVSHNTVENQEYGISMNACGFSDVSHNLVSGCAFISIEFANTLGCTASSNDMDCSAGASGYGISNNNADTRQKIDLHISGGRIVNANNASALGAYNVSGLSVDNVYASGMATPFVIQLTDGVTLQNCQGVIGSANSNGIYSEVGSGQTFSGFHYLNNQLIHTNGPGAYYSPFIFYCGSGSGTFNDVLIKNNYTDQTFSGSNFIQYAGGVVLSPLVIGNIPENSAGQLGFQNADTIGTTTIDGPGQTAGVASPGLNILQSNIDLGGSDLLAAGETFTSYLGGATQVKLGGVAGVVGDPGNINNFPGGLALFYKAADGASGSLHEGMRLDLNGNVGIGTKSPAAKLEVNGAAQIDGNLAVNGAATITGTLSATSFITTILANPTTAPTLATGGTAGSTSYGYAYSYAQGDYSQTIVSPTGNFATGNATLSAQNYNTISGMGVPANTAYVLIYRVAGGSSQGYIGQVAITSGTTTFSFNDTGLAGSATYTASAVNNTGVVKVGGNIVGGQSAMTLNTTGTITFKNTGYSETIYNPSTTTLSSGTITLPTTSTVGQTVRYTGNAAISSITITGTVDIGSGLTSYPAGSRRLLAVRCQRSLDSYPITSLTKNSSVTPPHP